MKNFIFTLSLFIFSVLVMNLAHAQVKMVPITGEITGSNVSRVSLTLSEITGSTADAITTTTTSDGKFGFNVPFSNLSIYRLSATSDNFVVLIFTGQPIHLLLNAAKLNLNPLITGSDYTLELYAIAARSGSFDMRSDSINRAYSELRKTNSESPGLLSLQQAYEENDKRHKNQLAMDILAVHSNPAGLFFIDKLDIDTDYHVFELLSSELYSHYPEYKLVKDLKQRVDLQKRLQPGNPAIEIELPDPDGNLVKLSSLRGKVVLIDFWASWCGPCRRDNPEVVRMYAKFKDKGFEIFGVSLDRDASAWKSAIEKDGLTWVHVSDLKYWQSAGAESYGVKAIPYTVLIDRDGKIIATKLRGKELENKLDEIFTSK